MYKFILLAALCSFAACKNDQKGGKSLTDTKSTKAGGFTAEEMEFVDGCVENAKANLGEEKAFILCKCILTQFKKENPSMDSTIMVRMMNDTAKIARLAANCK